MKSRQEPEGNNSALVGAFRLHCAPAGIILPSSVTEERYRHNEVVREASLLVLEDLTRKAAPKLHQIQRLGDLVVIGSASIMRVLGPAALSGGLEATARLVADLIPERPDLAFRFVAVDLRRMQGILAVDLLNTLPWYWRCGDGLFTLTTSPRSASASSQPSSAFLASYLTARYNYTYGHRQAPFQGVHSTLPGEVMSFSPEDGVRQLTQVRPSALGNPGLISEDAAGVALTRDFVLQSAMAIAESKGNREVAVLLSGGLDSGVALASLRTVGEKPVGVSATFDVASHLDESAAAMTVATSLGCEFHAVAVEEKDFADALAGAYRMHEFPLATSACLAFGVLLERLSEKAPMSLVSGGTADDIFAGNYVSYLYALADLFVSNSTYFDAEMNSWTDLHSTVEFPKNLDVFLRFVAANVNVESLGVISPAIELPFAQFVRPETALLAATGFSRPVLRGSSYLAAAQEYGVIYSAKPPGLIPGMEFFQATGLGSTDLFVTRNLIMLGWSLDNRLKVRHGLNKWVLRMAFADVLPRSTAFASNKTGFDVPVQAWLARRGPLWELYNDVLRSEWPAILEEFVDRSTVLKHWTARHEPERPLMFWWQLVNAVLWLSHTATKE